MSPTNPPQDPPPGGPWIPGGIGQQRAAGLGAVAVPATPTEAITEAGLGSDARAAGTGGLGGARPAGSGQVAGLQAAVDMLDRLSQRLAIVGLRLAILHRRAASTDEMTMLRQASDDLDEAIAEIRRLALTVRASGQPAPAVSPDGPH